MEFGYVDVFATAPFTGNPATVVLDADDADEPTMRAIAREFNQSETAFVLAAAGGGADWRLRAFTPTGAEVYGVGHFALGAAALLAERGRLPAGRTGFVQQIGTGRYPTEVAVSGTGPATVTIGQAPPEFGRAAADRTALAAALGLDPADLAPNGVAEVVSTGAGHLLVQARDRAAVDRIRPAPDLLLPVLDAVGGEGCAVFSLDPAEPGAHAHLRFVNPRMGIAEDPATGTAAGPLAVVLVRDGLVDGARPVVIVQGHAVGRPSRLAVRVDGDTVRLSGTGLVVATGSLRR
ncbi:PhzF family phenazine biosynthesis protein [Actinocatenispora thailandica]|nr:PhzF family phenazine biosynthesis protein [Actinocatenispora thailandica]